jgi:hypothetical protein
MPWRFALEVTEGGLPGGLVGLADRAAQVGVTGQGVKEADALGAGEEEVVAWRYRLRRGGRGNGGNAKGADAAPSSFRLATDAGGGLGSPG